MTEGGATVMIRRGSPRDDLIPLIDAALARARVARGGAALLAQLWGEETSAEQVRTAVDRAIGQHDVWVGLVDEHIVAGALVRDGCVQAIWVQPAYRRRGVATSLLRTLLDGGGAPQDAWALPGDRATKSLYESVGWKARLLTMRGA